MIYIIVILIAACLFFYHYLILQIQTSKRRSLEDIYDNEERRISYGIGNKRTPSDYDFDFEDIEFTTRDGLKLKGWYLEGGPSAIVMCHGRSGNRLATMQFLEILQNEAIKKEYSILLFDMRNGGESPKARTGVGEYFKKDIEGAFEFMLKKGHKDFITWGFSMGSLGLLKAISEYKSKMNIRKIILDSPLANASETIAYSFVKEGQSRFLGEIGRIFYTIKLGFRINSYTLSHLLGQLDYPTIILQSKKDIITPFRIFQREMAKLKEHTNLKTIYFEDGEHLKIRNIHRERYDNEIKDFILGGRSGENQ